MPKANRKTYVEVLKTDFEKIGGEQIEFDVDDNGIIHITPKELITVIEFICKLQILDYDKAVNDKIKGIKKEILGEIYGAKETAETPGKENSTEKGITKESKATIPKSNSQT